MRALRVVAIIIAAAGILAFEIAALAVAIYALGGRSDPRQDVYTHFAPVFMAGGLMGAIAALLLPLRWARFAIALPGLAAATGAAVLVGPEIIRPASPRAPVTAPAQLKLIQFNTWTFNPEPEKTARWIVEQNADVVVIEEPTAPIVDAMLRQGVYHVTGRDKPVVIFSRAKPVDADFPSLGPRPTGALTRARFAPIDGGFTVVGVHYTWPTQWARQQKEANDTVSVLRETDAKRAILVGDFNSTPWSFARRREDARIGLERRTRALATWPARNRMRREQAFPFPFLPIDHVYAGSDWRTVSVRRGPRLGSDHYPVVVILARIAQP